ncbi:MAG: SDR family oxidoreductase, partial [Deltaproteobacteria bacterium]|nr:SDR family oxidoreductase [Kofleriaceae bacterium]
RGIGRATALALAAEGARVVCLDRAEDSKDTSELARQIGGTALLLDVTAPDASARILEALGERGVDIVVHNAGITRDKTLARMKPEHWDAVMAVNLAAVVRITDALVPRALRDGGRVVCLSSVSGIAGNVGQTNYSASKAALIGYVDALATQLAPRGITANAIAPGFIETRMTAAIPMMIREAGRRLSALGQGGLPEDVAQAITFLASPGAQGITGSTLRVCGGALIGA